MKKQLSHIFSFGLLVIYSGFVTSATSLANLHNSPSLNQQMKLMAEEMLDLFPYLFSVGKFTDPQKQKFIGEKINRLSELFSKTSPHFKELPLSRKISHQIFQDHLADTSKVFKGPNKIFAQTMLRGAANICMSCHSLDFKEKALFQEVSRSHFISDFEYAEFQFMTRNYTMANSYYDQFLQGPWEAKDASLREIALNRKLFIFAEITNNPTLAQNYFKEFGKKSNIPKFLKVRLAEWEQGFKDWNKFSQALGEKNLAGLEKLAKKYFRNSSENALINGHEVIDVLRLRREFNDYLNKNPQHPETPQILYWLALLERSFEDNLFYPFATMSLKECMVNYPSHPVAKSCFKEYKAAIVFSYSGSSGTHIPAKVQKELSSLRKLIN